MGKLPICDMGKIGGKLAKTLYLWGFLREKGLKRGGTPLQMGYEWHWRGMRMVLFQPDDTNNQGNGMDGGVGQFKWVIFLII